MPHYIPDAEDRAFSGAAPSEAWAGWENDRQQRIDAAWARYKTRLGLHETAADYRSVLTAFRAGSQAGVDACSPMRCPNPDCTRPVAHEGACG